jgi:hypothetical protein
MAIIALFLVVCVIGCMFLVSAGCLAMAGATINAAVNMPTIVPRERQLTTDYVDPLPRETSRGADVINFMDPPEGDLGL